MLVGDLDDFKDFNDRFGGDSLLHVSYFQAVRLYSIFELCIFTALVVTWVGGFSPHTQLVLGWCHGFGWIGLCIAIAIGCTRRVFSWPVLAAAVSPLGPLGSTIAIEIEAYRRRHPATKAA